MFILCIYVYICICKCLLIYINKLNIQRQISLMTGNLNLACIITCISNEKRIIQLKIKTLVMTMMIINEPIGSYKNISFFHANSKSQPA